MVAFQTCHSYSISFFVLRSHPSSGKCEEITIYSAERMLKTQKYCYKILRDCLGQRNIFSLSSEQNTRDLNLNHESLALRIKQGNQSQLEGCSLIMTY